MGLRSISSFVLELLVDDRALNAGLVAATLRAVEELGRLEVGREAMLLAGKSFERRSNFLNAVALQWHWQ